MTPRAARPATAMLAIAFLAGCASAPGHGDAANGSIEGVIHHPAHAVPALRVCAIANGAPTGTPTGASRHCIATRAGADRYRIPDLPAGDYRVFAEAADGPYRFGGHMQPVQCIRAPCPAQPKTVALPAGATLRDIDLGDFGDTRDGFPALSPK